MSDSKNETTSEVMMDIAAAYLINNCEGCPFHGIEEYELKQRCDTVPLNCIWWNLERYFKKEEEKERIINEER